MIVARYLPALVVALALACVPTLLHSYVGMTVADSRTLTALPLLLNGLEGRPTTRSAEWVRDVYGTTDFIERHYGRSLTLFVARSSDAKRLYHHPELGVAHGDGYDRAFVVRRPERPEVPIFVLESDRGRVSVYSLLYEDQFVAHPMPFQLRNALALLVRPRALMTLFFVRGTVDATAQSVRASEEALLLAAIESFVAQPGIQSP